MPLYEYQCLNGHRFEVRHPITAEPVRECPECHSEVRRVIHPVGIVFKGSGFYVNDSRGKSSTATPSSSDTKSDAAATTDTKSEPAKTESKAESKPSATAESS